MPALLFTFAGIAAFLSKRRGRLPVCAVFFLVAFCFKQSFISAPISVALALLLTRRWKEFLVFNGIMAGALSVFFLLAFAITGANYFQNTILL